MAKWINQSKREIFNFPTICVIYDKLIYDKLTLAYEY